MQVRPEVRRCSRLKAGRELCICASHNFILINHSSKSIFIRSENSKSNWTIADPLTTSHNKDPVRGAQIAGVISKPEARIITSSQDNAKFLGIRHGRKQQPCKNKLKQRILPSTLRPNLQQCKQQFLQQGPRRTKKKHVIHTKQTPLYQARCKLCIRGSCSIWITSSSQ